MARQPTRGDGARARGAALSAHSTRGHRFNRVIGSLLSLGILLLSICNVE